MNKSYDYVLQQSYTDCGIASIMTVLMYYGIKPSREAILSKVKQKDCGYAAYDLIKISKHYGINAYGVRSQLENIDKLPAIAHTIKNENMFHFIVILEINKKKQTIKVMDPEDGIKTLSFEKFHNITTDIFLIFEGKKKKKIKSKRFKAEILAITKEHKKIIIKTVILSIFCVLLSLIFNYYLKTVLVYYKNASYLIVITVSFITLIIIKNILYYLKNKLVLKLNIKIDHDTTKKVISHIFNLPYKYFITKKSGELLTLVEDIENFKEVITKVFILSSVDLILIIVIIIYTSILNIYIGLYLALVLLILYIITKKYQYIFNDAFIKYKQSKIKYTSLILSHITSFETIKNLNISKKITTLLDQNYNESLKQEKIYNTKNYNYNFLISFLTDASYIIYIMFSILIIIKTNMNYLDIVLYSSIFYLIIGLLNNITESIVLYKVYETSIDRVLDCLDVKEEVQEKPNFSSINKINYKNISYKTNNKYLLKDISLEIKKGDIIYLTGESGLGKSTMMKLLLKYYNSEKGNILIDNINIKDLNISFLRDNITYISQNETLFQGTIKDNLELITKDQEKIKEIAKITQLDEFLSQKNINLNYVIEESGSNISGGERKKIILARGLLHFKDVLILDEVFNEISISEEGQILKNIISKYKNKIIIVISHRNSNKNLFNKKFELKGDGKLYEIN